MSIASLARPQVTMEATSEQAIYEFLQKLSREMTNGAGPFGPTPLRRMY